MERINLDDSCSVFLEFLTDKGAIIVDDSER